MRHVGYHEIYVLLSSFSFDYIMSQFLVEVNFSFIKIHFFDYSVYVVGASHGTVVVLVMNRIVSITGWSSLKFYQSVMYVFAVAVFLGG